VAINLIGFARWPIALTADQMVQRSQSLVTGSLEHSADKFSAVGVHWVIMRR